MKYIGKRITSYMRFEYLFKLWLAKKFGSKKIVETPDGIPCESERDIASMLWHYIWHSNDHYDRHFVNDQIWYALASDEEQQTRAEFEDADRRIYGGP